MKFKYLIIDNGTGIEVPIIFSQLLQHDFVAGSKTVISAGFVRFQEDGSPICGGHSISLNKKSRMTEDDAVIKENGNFGF